jgi:hypothetical protein
MRRIKAAHQDINTHASWNKKKASELTLTFTFLLEFF